MRSWTSTRFADLGAIGVCSLGWGTTWYAITLQLGSVAPVVSIVYRFGLAAITLLIYALLRREKIALTGPQHLAAAGVGLFTFTIDYGLIYYAEQRIASATVALIFASMAFFNLVMFRVLIGQRSPRDAWIAAALGVTGVGVLSYGELAAADWQPGTIEGLAIVLGAVVAASLGNVCAHRGDAAGTPLIASTAWAMIYGVLFLTLSALATGATWSFAWTPSYVGSLLYLAVIGSVVCFLLYFSLARRRGYTVASYISAIIPLIAMLMSSLFEGKSWPPASAAGVAIVLFGQWLLLRAKAASAPPHLEPVIETN